MNSSEFGIASQKIIMNDLCLETYFVTPKLLTSHDITLRWTILVFMLHRLVGSQATNVITLHPSCTCMFLECDFVFKNVLLFVEVISYNVEMSLQR